MRLIEKLRLARRFRATRLLCVVIAGVCAGAAAQAQTPRPAELRVTATDPSGAVIIGATTEVERPSGEVVSALSDGNGVATIPALPPGTYKVRVSAPGFDVATIDGLRLRSGVNRQTVQLSIAALVEEVVVERDPRERATDPRGDGFSTVLSADEIDQLPDDPDEMQQALEQMAGPGSTMRVNGFRGGDLPPKSQIREIRFRRNTFAAENHEMGFVNIDILTKPGTSAWRGSASVGFRDDALNARAPLAPDKTDSQQRRGSFSLDGPLVRNRTSLSLSVNGYSSYDTSVIRAVLPTGLFEEALVRPVDRASVTARLEHGLTKSHTMQVEFQRSYANTDGLGVGQFDLPERAYSRDTEQRLLRVATSGSIGKKAFNELRVQVQWNDLTNLPLSLDRAVRVEGAFNAGGAQLQGGRQDRTFEIADNLDINRGKHAIRAGVLFEGGRYDSDVIQNIGGTFTFPALAAYELGLATTYRQKIGDPAVAYSTFLGAWYVQDDYRATKALTLSAGIRHEWQSHLDDVWNFAPRVGFAWAPFENGRTTFRGGAGIFYDWFDAETYEQTLQVDGTTLQDVLVFDPGFPDPLSGGRFEVLPQGRIDANPGMVMPEVRQTLLGVERQLASRARLNVSYTYRAGVSWFRARDVNAPDADGNRPDPGVGTILDIDSIGRSREHNLMIGTNINIPWHRIFFGANYTFAHARDDGDSTFSLPANSLAPDEWGPSRNDVRHRLGLFSNLDLWKGFRLGTNLRVESGRPYNITTGFDTNQDGAFTDRPPGVGRNSARGGGLIDVNMRLGWRIGFGDRGQPAGPRGPQIVRVRGGEGGDMMGGMPIGGDKRVTTEIYAQAFNLLNRANYTIYSGVLTSQLFGQPLQSQPGRRIELGLRINF